MAPALQLHLRDLGRALVEAWRREFDGVPGVTISQGDIFSERAGTVSASDPIDVRADAVVSPANSFGFMDGGIDAVYTYQLGPQVQERLRELLAKDHGGELPVGQAVLVPTGRPEIPWCISAPTMRVPADVSDTVNAYLAFRAALRAVLAHNATAKTPIRTMLCPGLATAVGRMPPERCARQMKEAWVRTVMGRPSIPHSLRQAAEDDFRLRVDPER
ncbi:macro domain-containing protein [Corallococcus caeni]|uniref:Macro domain-containing protein n=1 Tax=Corallococcus caeni TaxID=3082388 RepID=A0ABQ6QYZ1_9BACT|nr:macro domain-containing protein [Corallococcus sp. NO1]